MSVVFKVVCALLLIGALVLFLIKSRTSGTGASKGQLLLSGFQLLLCGWFFALCFLLHLHWYTVCGWTAGKTNNSEYRLPATEI